MKKTGFLLGMALCFLSVNFQMVRADVLDKWTTNQITSNSYLYGAGLHHVVFGNGVYVAVGESGDGGEIYSSTDGFNWTLRFSDNNSWGLSLNYANGAFSGAADGFDTVCVSTNGTNWVQTFFPGTTEFSPAGNLGYGIPITYGSAGLYVAVGATNNVGAILTSPDGVSWTYRKTSALGGVLAGVCYGAGKFVAIGNNDGHEYTSTTGTGTWAQATIPGGDNISFANTLFFVPWTSNSNLVSANGTSWTALLTGLTNKMGAVTYSHGLYMAQ
jgi:hypothetical protein